MIFSLLPTVHLKIICLYNISPPRASSTYVEKKVKRTNRQDRYQIEKSICLVFWLDIHYKCKYHLQLLQGFVSVVGAVNQNRVSFWREKQWTTTKRLFVHLSLFLPSVYSVTLHQRHIPMCCHYLEKTGVCEKPESLEKRNTDDLHLYNAGSSMTSLPPLPSSFNPTPHPHSSPHVSSCIPPSTLFSSPMLDTPLSIWVTAPCHTWPDLRIWLVQSVWR